jgi:DNA-binding NarL/FixJ family response regulator
VTGAYVLVAMFAGRESHAVYLLKEQDMTRADAVNYISHGIAKAPDSTRRQIEAPRPEIPTTSLERAVIECFGQAEVIALIAGKLNISSSIVRGHIRNI